MIGSITIEGKVLKIFSKVHRTIPKIDKSIQIQNDDLEINESINNNRIILKEAIVDKVIYYMNIGRKTIIY